MVTVAVAVVLLAAGIEVVLRSGDRTTGVALWLRVSVDDAGAFEALEDAVADDEHLVVRHRLAHGDEPYARVAARTARVGWLRSVDGVTGLAIEGVSTRSDRAGSRPPRLPEPQGPRLYVVDSGIEAGHEAFDDVRVWGGVSRGATALVDCSGHGTAVASAAVRSWRACGRARGDLEVVAVQVLDCDDRATHAEQLADALGWIVDVHEPGDAAVALLSLDLPADPAIAAAVAALRDRGVTPVTSAGNDGGDACDTGGAADALVVGALDENGRVARSAGWGSRLGACVDRWAPGLGVEVADARDHRSMIHGSGTSVAAALVAGELLASCPQQYSSRQRRAGSRRR